MDATSLAIIVALSTWLAPHPAHMQGRFVYYGSQRLIEANASYRGYDLSHYPERCGLSAIGPDGLGKIYWIRVPGGKWHGPCLAVDVVAQRDFYLSVYDRQEIAELGAVQREWLGFRATTWGEVHIGLCPPDESSTAQWYAPDMKIQRAYRPEPALWPFPAQQMPVNCHHQKE